MAAGFANSARRGDRPGTLYVPGVHLVHMRWPTWTRGDAACGHGMRRPVYEVYTWYTGVGLCMCSLGREGTLAVTSRPPMSDPSAMLRHMERYVWVRNARLKFADMLNTAAYGSERIVILRRGEELCFVGGLADLDYLRRHRPLSRFPEPPPTPPEPTEAEIDLERREENVRYLERLRRTHWAGDSMEHEISEERAAIEKARRALMRN